MKKVIMLENKDGVITKNYGNYLALDLTVIHHTIKRQHLYITNDQEVIKEDDWYIDNRVVSQPIVSNTPMHKDKEFACKKIVASTNSKLNLPLINKEFIQLYVEKQGKIEEVSVSIEDQGCEEWQGDDYSGQPVWNEKLVAFVTPKEEVDDVRKLKPLGEINYEDTAGTWIEIVEVTKGRSIRPSEIGIAIELFELGKAWQKERMYSKDEVIEIIYKSSYVLAHGDSTKQDADEWISQNLKK